MSWVLLLIQLIPTLISVIKSILEMIDKLKTKPERVAARKELRELAKAHVTAPEQHGLAASATREAAARDDLTAMLDRLTARTVAV